MIDGRQENGRFAAGWKGGPGRPPRAVEADYLAAIGEVVSIDDWREIASRAVADAKSGDARAREWLGRYLVGDRPVEIGPATGSVAIYVPSNGRFSPPAGPTGTLI